LGEVKYPSSNGSMSEFEDRQVHRFDPKDRQHCWHNFNLVGERVQAGSAHANTAIGQDGCACDVSSRHRTGKQRI